MEEKRREVILKIEGGKRKKYTRYELHKVTIGDDDKELEIYRLYAFDKDGEQWYVGQASHDYVADRLLSIIEF